ncbi:hypothetical protein [Synechococcus sp. UW105]|uniref:hypothetical protein n=1 Tax=Synechococcus sp. UW105 TaxID=337067 RepID=UPI000E0FE3EC|nr:hypothetical protein [Synechococcus sp. UW105]
MNTDDSRRPLPLLAWINTIASVLIGLGLGGWLWLMQHRNLLPSPEVSAGKTLLKQYQATSHDLFLALLALSVLTLVVLIRRAQHQQEHSLGTTDQTSRPNQLLRFTRQHPLVLALFAGYTVAMVHGTTWMYPELVGWFKDIPEEHLLNNFSFRHDFLRETMRRDDYRFFPLAHQDLHILSWFTGYVKMWMLVSAAELFTIVVVSARFVRRLSGRTQIPALLLITSLLLLFHPATGMAFFQFSYCERFLTFILALYCGAYLHHHQHRDKASFYAALLFGLIGIFIKDIAVVLFVVPPAVMLIAGSLGLVEGRPSWTSSSRAKWVEAYRLELWLCSLALIFLLAYVVLSLLPSAFANKGSYNKNKGFLFAPDWRFWCLIGFCLVRAASISLGRSRVTLLDGLNLAALSYGAGLLVLIGFESHKYLSLPVQWVTVLDLCFIWTCWISPALERRSSARLAGAVGSAVVLGSIGLDHLQPPNVAASVSTIKVRQQSWLEAYQAIDATTAPIRTRGEAINLIYSKQSWFSAKRHLGRLRFDRLIEFDPQRNRFSVEEGTGKGEPYTPQVGDLLFTIDKDASTLQPLLERWPTQLLYQDNNGQKNGRIFRIQP